MMLTYRYTYIGSRMIVYEYEGGRKGHTYVGKPHGEYDVELKPITNGHNAESRVRYKVKHTNWFMMTRLPDYGSPKPAPIEPPARVSPRADEPAEPEVLDNSQYVGEQLKII